ncbi:MAG: hypothetical protein C0608_01900 [Deltaproteobacteria bacterium]|nr:MAG: hypothetical protein C0608_01900 [Deltaproteobacteria bacterium]
MEDKLKTLGEAASLIASGSSISIGGFTSQRHPTALLRKLIKDGVRDLIIYCHSAGSDVDLLIGAGSVKRVEGAYQADGVFTPISPNWRRFVEAGRIHFEDYSNASMMARFAAGAMGLPFMPVKSMLGSDLMERWGFSSEERKVDPEAAPAKVHKMECPFTGQQLALVPAIKTDFCLLHVQKASPQGLLRIEGQEFLDVQQAMASRCVIATCEEVVKDEELRRNPELNRIPHFAVDAVVHLPFGAHPHSVHNAYDYDPEHLMEFSRASKDDASFDRYLERYVFGPDSHEEYLELIGGEARMRALRARSGLGYNPELARRGGDR